MIRHQWHKRLALAWALVVCVLLGHNAYLWLGKRIVPDTDILALLPVQERDPVLQQSFKHMVDAAQQRVIVLIGAPDWQDAKRASDAYNAVLATKPGVLSAVKLSDETQADWLAPFQKHSLALLTASQEAQLRSAPPQFWSDAALAKLYGAFAGPKLGAFRDDPFDLFSGWIAQRAQETPVRPRDGKLFVADAENQYVLMPLTMAAPAFSLSAQQVVVPLLEQAALAARSAAPKARVITAGVVLHAAAAGAQAESEVSTIGVGSLAGIVLLTWLTFRSVRPIALVMVSIGIGFLGSLSVCWLLFGSIHLMTLVFGASLIGVAQDYGIYFLCHRLGTDARTDSVTLIRRLLPGLALTLTAAVVGYLGLGFTPFPGLRHMAVFSAVGLIFAWLTVVLWFPALVGPGTLKSGALSGKYGASLVHWPKVRMNGATLLAFGGFAAVAAFGIARLVVDDDIRSLQTPPKHLIDDQIKLSKLLDAPTPVQYYLVRGPSAEIVLQREEALKKRLDPLIEAKRINGYQAMSNWVPSQRTQGERRALIESALLGDTGPLAKVAETIGEDAAWVSATRAHLLAPVAALTPEAFLRTPPSEPWRHLWLGESGGVYASIVALRGLSMAGLPDLRRAAEGMDGVQWVDKVAEISSVLGRYRAYMGWAVLAAYAVVLALLVPRYGAHAWRILAPTAIATIATLAILGLTGQKLQLFHVLALMLLLGVGVDYGIFMQENSVKGDTAPWLAVGLSAASTLLSFGLLGLSGTPALHAFGLTMLIGIATSWLLVPCFAKNLEDRHA